MGETEHSPDCVPSVAADIPTLTSLSQMENIMLILDYPSKKALREAVGQRLRFTETAVVGVEYTPDGVIYGSNRPHKTGHKREFYAQVTMKDGLISKVK